MVQRKGVPLESKISLAPWGASRVTLVSLFLFESQPLLLRKRSSLRYLLSLKLAQQPSLRAWLFTLLSLLAHNSRRFLALRYYFLKLLVAYFHSLAFVSSAWRGLLLRLEALIGLSPLGAFSRDWFCYERERLITPLVLPFHRYLLRLDMYSFFFLWSAMEGIRISLYNGYIKAFPELWERPSVRRALIQTWYPRRRCYLEPLDSLFLPQDLRPFEHRSLRLLLSDRFSIMFLARKYLILGLLESKTLYWREMQLPRDLTPLVQNDAFLGWLRALSASQGAAWDFLKAWDGPQMTYLYFIFFMKHPKRFRSLDRWRIQRHFYYFHSALVREGEQSDDCIGWTLQDYSTRYRRAFYHRIFSHAVLQHAFLVQDLYSYSSFSWENFLSFIDRHFCYRVLAMKYNWFFDRYFLRAQSFYRTIHQSLDRPFRSKSTDTYSIQRSRALIFAKRFLLRFCALPMAFSYTLLGLEYYYWRLHELNAIATWTHNVLALTYYYVKLSIDKLLCSRYRSLLQFLHLTIRLFYPSLHMHSAFHYNFRNVAVYQRHRWLSTQSCFPFNAWILFHLSALRSIFLQSLNKNPFLALLHFSLLQASLAPFALSDLSLWFHQRLSLCLQYVEFFNHFLLADRCLLIHVAVDWWSPRARLWLAPFNVEEAKTLVIEGRYGHNYQWKRTNEQKQVD